MSAETDVTTILSALAPTTPFASADAAARPRITYQRVTGSDNGHLAGAGPERVRLQIDAWADTYAAARGIVDQAKLALRAGLVVGSITDNPDDYEADTKLHRCSFDVALWPTSP
jgi:hypothetical protein